MHEKKYKCELCGRPINHQGNCLPCNIKKKYNKNITSFSKTQRKKEIKEVDKFVKSILDEDYYGDRMLLRRKQKKDLKFKSYVFQRYKYSCFFCGVKDLDLPLDIHHINYQIRCEFPKGRRGRKTKIVTCKRCKRNNPEIFEECMSSVLLLCRDCHEKLHKMMKESFGEWVPPKEINPSYP